MVEEEQPEWRVWELEDEGEARALQEWYESRQHETHLLHDEYLDVWLVAALADEDSHVLADQEASLDSFLGLYLGLEKYTRVMVYHNMLWAQVVE